MTEPTARDLANAALRKQVVDRDAADYARALAFCLQLFGSGFVPHGRHFLLDADECTRLRYCRTERPAPVATVYSARRGRDERHFVVEDGQARKVASIEEGMPMMHEPHLTKRIVVRGEQAAPARYELCWGWFEKPKTPRTAEQLAAARAKREAKAVEKEAAGNLFADTVRAEGPGVRGR